MSINISIISNYGNKTVDIKNINGNLINQSVNNEIVNLPFDSYIIYLSNPIQKSSITEILSYTDNILSSFFIFTLAIILLIVFYVFLMIIKTKGFKGGLK